MVRRCLRHQREIMGRYDQENICLFSHPPRLRGRLGVLQLPETAKEPSK
jgi:hypothetical protein